jgi:hypothetical protein
MAHEKEVVDFSTGEVEKVNDNFVQLYTDKIPVLLEIMRENRTAGNLFLWLIQHMDKRNALVVSQPALIEALGLSIRTIQYSVNYLKAKKALTILKSGNTNIYVINSQIAWKAKANGKSFALFDAAVYISAAEQEKPIFSTNLVGHAVKKPKKSRLPPRGTMPQENELSKDS